jgi:hypothetical protein
MQKITITETDLDNMLINEPLLCGAGFKPIIEVEKYGKNGLRIKTINRIIGLIEDMKKIKTLSSKAGSYHLKHVLEDIFYKREGNKSPEHYVSNGECIAAFIACGFKYKIYYGYTGSLLPNTSFNISSKSYKLLVSMRSTGYTFIGDEIYKPDI